jgi:hypothetical protein
MGVMAVAVLSVVGAMGSGMQLVGHSRQRSTGTNVAIEKLERMRNLPYDEVALLSEDAAHPLPVHSTEAGHPNNKVSTDNLRYRVSDNPPVEEPLVAAPTGGLWHEEDPLDIDGTEFRVLQYVTQQAASIKRVIVVVVWKFPVASGTSHEVIQSTLVTDGTINLPTPTPSSEPTSSPSLPAPTPSAAPNCDQGSSLPSGSVDLLSGAGAETGFTNSTSVQVEITANDDNCLDVTAQLSNDDGPEKNWTPVVLLCTKQCDHNPPRTGMGARSPATVAWTIPGDDGATTIYMRLVDGGGRFSAQVYSKSITLDNDAPGQPGSFQKSACNINGNDRVLSFTWTAGTLDPNFRGFRLYRSIDSGQFTSVATVAGSTVSDTEKKSYNSIRYFVVQYDKAGNESIASAILSFSKNNCG